MPCSGELSANLEGEVPFRLPLSCSLFHRCQRLSNSARSVSWFRKPARTSFAPLKSAPASAAPLPCAAAALRRPARPSAKVSRSDTSKYYNRLLEVNAEQLWVRVEPGIVLDELNAQLAPLGMRFAPDISTASPRHHRRHDGQPIPAARAACSMADDRIMCWSKTVILSDGSIVHFREIPRSEVPSGDTLEAGVLSHGAWT